MRNETMHECEVQIVYNYEIYPRDGIVTTSKGFVIIDICS